MALDTPAPAVLARDAAGDRLTLLRGTGIVALGFGVGSSLQSAWIYAQLVPDWAYVDLWRRLAANGAAVVVLLLALGLLRVHRARGGPVIFLRLLLAALLMSVLRTVVQIGLGVHPADDRDVVLAEVLTGLFVGVVAAGTGAWGMVARRRARAMIRRAEREAVSIEIAVQALEDEEVRIRRRLAEGLHGTLQQRLVLVERRLEAVAAAADRPELAADVAWVREQIAEAREIDVRQMSRLLYPELVEVGLVPAVRALLGRLPRTIATRLTVGDELRRLDDPAGEGLATSDRLLAVRVVEEAVTNALKHGPPARVEVRLDVAEGALVIVVTNDGEPYVAPAARDPRSGTARLEQRLRVAGGTLRVERGPRTGARVEAVLPLGVLPPGDRLR